MARVTVEDCILKVPNRFELVLVASQRAREIGGGAPLIVDRDNDKNPVVSLREIADTDISLDGLREALVKNHQKVIELEEEDEDIIDVMEGESEWAQVSSQAADGEMDAAGLSEDDGEGDDTADSDDDTDGDDDVSLDDFAGDMTDDGMDDDNI